MRLDVEGQGGTTSRAEATVIVYKALYVNQSDDSCGGRGSCFTSIKAALERSEQVKMISNRFMTETGLQAAKPQ